MTDYKSSPKSSPVTYRVKYSKWTKKIEVWLKKLCLHHGIPPLLFSQEFFKAAQDSNCINEGDAIWLSPRNIREPAKVAMLHWLTADKKNHEEEERLRTYCQVVKYTLETMLGQVIVMIISCLGRYMNSIS